MPQHSISGMDGDRSRLSGPTTATFWALVVAGLAALVVARWLGGDDASSSSGRNTPSARLSASYLVSYCFFLSLSLGALFFVSLQHLVRAGWSVTVRRLAEILAMNVAWWGALFLPILVPVVLGTSRLYGWSRPAMAAADPLLQWKSAYLNGSFFAARAAFYFLVWALSAWCFFRQSKRQDDSRDPRHTRRMERAAPGAMILFALTVTFASFDWLMSLEPKWASTIYGLYFFAGSVVGSLAALILMALALQKREPAVRAITTEHYHELGKLLLGFVVFWGYMAFSQYLLIWYANVPEETVWYRARQTGPWVWVTLGLLVGNLLVPFLGLLPREVKRRRILLGAWAAWLLIFHWIDVYWLIMPTFAPERVPFGAMDLCCATGLGCLFLGGMVRTAGACALVPLGDPRLGESLAFENS
jgi:hypothetical protein